MAQKQPDPMPDLKIDVAKAIAKDLKVEGIMIFAIDVLPDGRFKGVSYGSTKTKCALMGMYLDKIVGLLQSEGER